MSSMPSPLSLHLLADGTLAPAAALLVFNAEGMQALQQLAVNPDFAAFAEAFPCLVRAASAVELPAELLATLQRVGVTVVDAPAIFRTDGLTRPVLPTGAVWLDGDWFLAPPQRPSGAQSASRALALKLLQLVMANAETRDIDAVLRQDPALSYHLLRLVNSLGMGMTRRITSFSQAIMILGRMQLRRWLNLMLFAARPDDYRAPMLLARVAVRARSMELLAKEMGLDHADQDLAFMAGMFSMLGTLFGTPLPELIRPLQLSEVLVAAVTDHQGPVGCLLQLQKCADLQDTSGMAVLLDQSHLTTGQFSVASLAAYQWMLGIARETQGEHHV